MNVYEDTLNILLTRGRRQFKMTNTRGQTCLVGALNLAKGINYDYMFNHETDFYRDIPETDKLAKIIKEQFSDSPYLNKSTDKSHQVCYDFNDGHSDEDIMLILEKAAADE